jgi:hypothetical protein
MPLLTNHTLTGVVLGLSIDNPWVLAPTAVASHLVMDAIPHFGHPAVAGSGDKRQRGFVILGSIDFTLSIAITVAACIIWPSRILNILVGVFGADLPDFTYIPIIMFGRDRIFRLFPFYAPLQRFLGWIQWYEKPPGAITEILIALIMLTLLRGYLPS